MEIEAMFPTATAQDKFMLMLLERVDKLTDEVQQLKALQNNSFSIPDTKTCADRFCCPNIGCIGQAAFIRARLANDDAAKEFLRVLRTLSGVEAFVYDARPTEEYSIDEFEEDDIPYVPYGTFTIQALLCLKHSMVVSHIGTQLCNAFATTQLAFLELQPISDFMGGFSTFNLDEGVFKLYYYFITAAKHGIHPDNLIETQTNMEWMKHDGSVFVHEMEYYTGDDYGRLCEIIDTRNIHYNIFPWYLKI